MTEKVPQKIKKPNLKSQVEEALLDYIKQMDFNETTKLPREEVLAQMLGVSRLTLRSVLESLAVKGIILRKHGHGTFINKNYFEIQLNFSPAKHYEDAILESGYTPMVERYSSKIIKADKEIAENLGIQIGDEVLRWDKIFYADKQLCVIARDYLSLQYLREVTAQEQKECEKSVYYLIYEKRGRKIVWDKVELNAVYSEDIDWVSKLLNKRNVRPRSFLLLKGVGYDDESFPAVYTLEYIDTNILKYSQIRQKDIRYIDN